MTDDLNLPLPPDVVDAIRDAIEARYPNQPVLTPDEVAELLRISDDTVVRRFRKVKVATKWRIPVATLLADLANPRLCDERGSASVRAVATLALAPLFLALLGVLFGFAPKALAAESQNVLIFGPTDACTTSGEPYYRADENETLHIVVGKTYKVLATDELPSIGAAWWISGPGGKRCLVSSQQAALVKGSLDVSTFKSSFLVPDEQTQGFLTGEIVDQLLGAQPVIYSLPTRTSSVIDEMESGDILAGAAWTTDGESNLAGVGLWRPVQGPGGTLGWTQAEAFVAVPSYTGSEFTSTLTAPQTVNLYSAPSHESTATPLEAGGSVKATVGAWNGWYAVQSPSNTKRHLWLFASDLTESSQEAVEEDDSDWPKVAGVLSTPVDGYFEANGQKSETANSGVEMRCYEPVGEWVSCDWSSPTYEMGTDTERTAFFRVAELEAAGLEISAVEEQADGSDQTVVCETLEDKGEAALDPDVQCADDGEPGLIEKGTKAVDEFVEKRADQAALIVDKGRLRLAGLLALGAIVAAATSTAMQKNQQRSLLTKGLDLANPVGLLPHLLLPVAAVLGFMAGKAAPTRNFMAYSLTGALIVAAVIGLAVAVKMLAVTKTASFTSASTQYAGVTTAVLVPAAHWLGGASWPLSLVLAGAAAGLVAGLISGLLSNLAGGTAEDSGPAAQPPGDVDPFFAPTTEEPLTVDVGQEVAPPSRQDDLDPEAAARMKALVDAARAGSGGLADTPPGSPKPVKGSDHFWDGL